MQHYGGWYVCSPKNMVSFILKTDFAIFGTCNRGFSPKTPQKCRNIYVDVPFCDILILNLNVSMF